MREVETPRWLRLSAAAAASVLVGLLVGGGASYLVVRHFDTTTPAPVVVHNVTAKNSSSSLASLLKTVEPAVVQVVREPVAPAPVTAQDIASGFIASSSGLVVTSEGSVAGASGVEVALASGQLLPATIAASDQDTGIVVLQVSSSTSLPAPLSFSAAPAVGDAAIAVSLPYGGSPGVEDGSVSAVAMTATVPNPASTTGSQTLDGLLQTSFSDPLGSGGAPLVNGSGGVIGILTGTTMIPQDQGPDTASLGFALDSDSAQALVSGLSADAAAPASIGLVCRWLDPATAAALGLVAGAQVLSVTPGTVAATAGLSPGEVVTAVNHSSLAGQPSYPTLSDLLRSYGAGTQVTLSVYRAPSTHQLSLTLPPA